MGTTVGNGYLMTYDNDGNIGVTHYTVKLSELNLYKLVMYFG